MWKGSNGDVRRDTLGWVCMAQVPHLEVRTSGHFFSPLVSPGWCSKHTVWFGSTNRVNSFLKTRNIRWERLSNLFIPWRRDKSETRPGLGLSFPRVRVEALRVPNYMTSGSAHFFIFDSVQVLTRAPIVVLGSNAAWGVHTDVCIRSRLQGDGRTGDRRLLHHPGLRHVRLLQCPGLCQLSPLVCGENKPGIPLWA